MVIAGILLSNRAAYIQATLAVCLFTLLIADEFWTFAPSDPLFPYRLSQRLSPNTKYLVGLFAAFTAAVYITVYMTTSIVNTLRRREGELEAADRRIGDSQYHFGVEGQREVSVCADSYPRYKRIVVLDTELLAGSLGRSFRCGGRRREGYGW